MRLTASSLPLALLVLAACATGGTDPAAPDAAVPDASPGPDAPLLSVPDAEPVACWIRPVSDLGTLSGVDPSTAYDSSSKEWRISLALDESGDYRASIVLREGVGLFQNGVTTGKYDIHGADARYESCSLCVSVESREGLIENDTYRFQAASGALHVQAVDREAGTISGYLAGADFQAFKLSEKNGTICNEHSDCGRTWCGLLACAIQEPRPELCGFSIGRLNF